MGGDWQRDGRKPPSGGRSALGAVLVVAFLLVTGAVLVTDVENRWWPWVPQAFVPVALMLAAAQVLTYRPSQRRGRAVGLLLLSAVAGYGGQVLQAHREVSLSGPLVGLLAATSVVAFLVGCALAPGVGAVLGGWRRRVEARLTGAASR